MSFDFKIMDDYFEKKLNEFHGIDFENRYLYLACDLKCKINYLLLDACMKKSLTYEDLKKEFQEVLNDIAV